MITDPLDDILDRSAPATRAVPGDALAGMVAEARGHRPQRRGRRIAVTSGALALVLCGGAGVAAATDGFTWAPWAQDPLGAVAFTMDTGMSCELRYTGYTGGDAVFVSEVNRALEAWYRSADVVAAAAALVPEHRAWFQAQAAAAPLDPGADLSLLAPEDRPAEIAHRAWALEWSAWDAAVADAEQVALDAAGLDVSDARMAGSERSGQIQCRDAHGDTSRAGAGS